MTNDESLIRALIDAQGAAWNRGDAEAYAERFRADGTFTNVLGDNYQGKEAFEERHAEIFRGIYRGSTVKMPIRRIYFVRPDVAIVDIDAELSGFSKVPPGIGAPDGIVRASLLQVLIKEQEEWTIAAYHNVDVKPRPPMH
ncbi:MAG TPA: SgcJ/EcaC family oxidoreductase [Terriglobales bacterium]|nr:SgcJ/EcaC family oxidoreductase [Terriglobales bacterium]